MNLLTFLGHALLFILGIGLGGVTHWLRERRRNQTMIDDYRSYNDELLNP